MIKAQCFTCQWVLMNGHPKGKGVCWKKADDVQRDVLAQHVCKDYKIGAMDNVKSRTQQRIIFDNDGIARIE